MALRLYRVPAGSSGLSLGQELPSLPSVTGITGTAEEAMRVAAQALQEAGAAIRGLFGETRDVVTNMSRLLRLIFWGGVILLAIKIIEFVRGL